MSEDPRDWSREDWAELQTNLHAELKQLRAEIKRYREADIARIRAWEIARRLDEATKGIPPARSLAVSATDDGITIEMQCGARLLAVHLSPDEWDDFRADGDDARAAFEAGLEDTDDFHDLNGER